MMVQAFSRFFLRCFPGIVFLLSAFDFGYKKGHFFFAEEMSFFLGQVDSPPKRHFVVTVTPVHCPLPSEWERYQDGGGRFWACCFPWMSAATFGSAGRMTAPPAGRHTARDYGSVGGKRWGIPPGAGSIPELFVCNFCRSAKKNSEISTISELSHGSG